METFPDNDHLRTNLVMAADAWRIVRSRLDRDEEIAPGYRDAFVSLERFNFRAADLALMVDEYAVGRVPANVRADLVSTASVYLRNTFMAGRFYCVPTLGSGGTWFYVLENKVLPGCAPRDVDDAQTRPLVICFFKQVSGDVNEAILERVDASFSGMTTKVLTPAELALHLGYVVENFSSLAAAEAEALVERAWMSLPRKCYNHEHVTLWMRRTDTTCSTRLMPRTPSGTACPQRGTPSTPSLDAWSGCMAGIVRVSGRRPWRH